RDGLQRLTQAPVRLDAAPPVGEPAELHPALRDGPHRDARVAVPLRERPDRIQDRPRLLRTPLCGAFLATLLPLLLSETETSLLSRPPLLLLRDLLVGAQVDARPGQPVHLRPLVLLQGAARVVGPRQRPPRLHVHPGSDVPLGNAGVTVLPVEVLDRSDAHLEGENLPGSPGVRLPVEIPQRGPLERQRLEQA